MNMHSLIKNSEELCDFLNTDNHNFDVLVLSEIWSCNTTHYTNLIAGYSF